MQHVWVDERLQLSKARLSHWGAETNFLERRFREMPYVQSKALEHVTYDEVAHTLCATFRGSRRRFLYEGVPQEIYDCLLFAESLAGYFNSHIHGRFPYREI